MTSVMGSEPDYRTIDFEETELRLALPGSSGSGNDNESVKSSGKRGFCDADSVDLKLNLSTATTTKDSKTDGIEKMKEKNVARPSNDPAKPPAK